MSQINTRRKNYPFLIGLFVIVGSMILVGTIFWLGANEFLREQSFYVTYFESSVEGLEKGSPVKYQGVPVGSIEKISLAENEKIIQVMMQIDGGVSLSDTMLRVKLAMAGIAGGKFLQLHYNTNPVLRDMNPKIDFELPVGISGFIKSAPSDIDEISIAARDVMNNFKTLEIGQISRNTLGFLKSSSQFMDTATAFLSARELKSIMSNLEQSSISLAKFMDKTESSPVIDDVRETANNLYMTSQYLKNFAVRLNSQIDSMGLVDQSARVFSKYDSVMTGLAIAVERLTFSSSALAESMEQTLSEIRHTNRDLRKAVGTINSQPGALLSKPPPPEDD